MESFDFKLLNTVLINFSLPRYIIDRWFYERSSPRVALLSCIKQNSLDHPRMLIIDKRNNLNKLLDNHIRITSKLYPNQIIYSYIYKHILHKIAKFKKLNNIKNDIIPIQTNIPLTCIFKNDGVLYLKKEFQICYITKNKENKINCNNNNRNSGIKKSKYFIVSILKVSDNMCHFSFYTSKQR
tara:strand:+ start:12692 stop:13240 length:549 start_codon:yes stop_codon:yes gene_type:complete